MLRTAVAAVFGMAMLGTVAAGRGDAADLTVRLGRVPAQGRIVVMLFDSPEGFEDFRAPVRLESFDVREDVLPVLRDVPSGDYALVVFHDENDNRRVDVNFIGIPREPIGFANAYRPKGPPGFERAVLRIEAGQPRAVDVVLARPLGKRGRLGVGVGVMARGNPYQGAGDVPVSFIPAVIYMGNRLQVYGPFGQFGLAGSGNTRLAATLAYRMGVYDADENSSLAGMADRKGTAMAGLRMQRNTVRGFDLQVGYAHDLLDRIGGGEAQVGLARPIPWRSLRVTPSVSLNWMSAQLARHDVGVSAPEALAGRSVYRPGSSFSVEAGVGVFAELTPSLFGVFSTSVEWFDTEVRRSPIVDEDYVLKGMAFITYML